ncbi:MAG: translesion DNA synthesis-associated protein ImuA [Pseudomonadales bacterium]
MASTSSYRSEPYQLQNQSQNRSQNQSQNRSQSPLKASAGGAVAAVSSRAQEAARALLDHPGLWQAGKLSATGPTLASEYRSLDQHLAGGFPGDGLTELMVDQPGIGELQLLVPAMRRLSQTQDRWIVWINPPHRPYAPALRSCGIDIDKILVIQPKTAEEALWALEKVLQSGSSSMALAWIDERQLNIKHSRRLQLAAKQGSEHGQCLSVLFRPTAAAAQSSMASLRLQLTSAGPESLRIDICKRRGAWPLNGITIALEHAPSQQARTKKSIGEQLMLWRELNTTAVVEQSLASSESVNLQQQDVKSKTASGKHSAGQAASPSTHSTQAARLLH